MIIAGIDYSITCPAVCVYDSSKGELSHDTAWFYFNKHNPSKKEMNNLNVHYGGIPQFKMKTDIARYTANADWALSLCIEHRVDVVVLESYAMNAKGKVFNLAESTGLLKYYLTSIGIPIVLIPPTLNKKSFSGKGNAKKTLMIETFNMKNNIDIAKDMGYSSEYSESPVSDVVDAYSLIDTYLKQINKEKENDE